MERYLTPRECVEGVTEGDTVGALSDELVTECHSHRVQRGAIS